MREGYFSCELCPGNYVRQYLYKENGVKQINHALVHDLGFFDNEVSERATNPRGKPKEQVVLLRAEAST